MFLDKSYIWEKSCLRDTGQNAPSESAAGFLNQVFLLSKWMKQSHF